MQPSCLYLWQGGALHFEYWEHCMLVAEGFLNIANFEARLLFVRNHKKAREIPINDEYNTFYIKIIEWLKYHLQWIANDTTSARIMWLRKA